MDKYNHSEIEPKWQKKWEGQSLSKAEESSKKEKKYILDMFPYPSGAGLHVGHVESYAATDIYSRYLRMRGYNVLHPQGWDAFGLPAENYAIKTNIHPEKTTKEAIKTFKKQIAAMGLSYDWSREVNSSDPDYYKWTQWLFLLFYKNGLAHKKSASVNWCAKCQTVLANEQAEGGKCERCESEVTQKNMEQWFFKITDFIEDQEYKGRKVRGLISGLDDVDWPESTRQAQRNWIGKSVGAEVDFFVNGEKITVFTTRPDTLFGATYFVLSPEHPVITKLKSQILNIKEVEKYIADSKKKTELERTDLAKEKTGMILSGVTAVNPVNKEEIPVFIADYVLINYGTGAIMAVPAHDERDWEFAQKYSLPIKQVATPDIEGFSKTLKSLFALGKIKKEADKRDIKFWLVGGLGIAFYSHTIYRGHDDLDILVKDNNKFGEFIKLIEELGFKKIKEKKLSAKLTNFIYKNKEGVEIDIGPYSGAFGIKDSDFIDKEREVAGVKTRVISLRYIKDLKERQLKEMDRAKDKIDIDYINGKVFTGDGVAVNSGLLDGLETPQAKEKIIGWLEEKKLGQKAINYKIRDWLVSRQRYWGAPIPIIYCDKCGEVPVPEEDLPVKLPTDVDFKPTGESPLNYSKDFQDVQCPKCGGRARREADTMDTFVCSSWYYLRYADPSNTREFASKEMLEKWLPVDVYVGGAEHTVLHLLYARFFTKVLHKYGYVDFNEPFQKLRHQGIILAEDGTKMSKSKGNVVNPDDVVKQYGADALRMYEMFMGPLEDMKPWNTKGIVGISRFLERAWLQKEKINLSSFEPNRTGANILNLLHKTIKKVTEDIEAFKFNTAISQMMIMVNAWEKESNISKQDFELFLVLLCPFAPHITEELWARIGHKESIFTENWPAYDHKLIKDEIVELVIQVNGKVRDKMQAPADIHEKEAIKKAKELNKIKRWLAGKKVVKKIFVKGKLINFVIK